MRARWCLSPALLWCLSACGGTIDALDPMTGPPLVERCVDQDSDPDTKVSFTEDIQPIFKGDVGPGCKCHLPTEEQPIGFEQTGLSLETLDSLLDGGANSKSTIVIPGSPCESVLVQKISPGPPFGARMPFNGPPFLDDDLRQLISDWIAEGARAD